MLLSVFPLTAFANDTNDEFGYMNLDETDIEYDFKYIFAGAYKLEDYSSSKSKDMQLISVMESENAEGSKELYFYVYNPSQKNIYKNSKLNTINMSAYTSDDDSTMNDYNKLSLKLICSYGATKDDSISSNATILKFKCTNEFKNNAGLDRYYLFADMELCEFGKNTPKHFIVGNRYKFFEDEKGYINCSIEDLTTLEVDAFHTFYRANTASVDVYTDVQAVYFPVSNTLLNTYGELHSIKVAWEKCKLNTGIVVDSYSVFNDFDRNYIHYSEDELENVTFDYSVFYDRFKVMDSIYDYYTYGYNIESLSEYIQWDSFLNFEDGRCAYHWTNVPGIQLLPNVWGPIYTEYERPLNMAFYMKDISEDGYLSGQDIKSFLDKHNWDKHYISYSIPFTKEFTVEMKDESLDLYEACSGWEAFWAGDYYEKSTGEKLTFSPFMKIDLSDLKKLDNESFSEKYLVDKNDVSCEDNDCNNCISCVTSNEKYKNCTWFLLRYDTTKYRTDESLVVNNKTGVANVCNSFVFSTQVIKNFDTISIGFGKDVEDNKVITVFPIGRSPTNFVADASVPVKKPSLKIPDIIDSNKEFFENVELVLKVILAVVGFVLLLKLINLIKPIFDISKRKEKPKK